MNNKNAVAVMRVSSERQGFDGDSIDHQKDQIDLYAATRNIVIKKYFIFIESASKEQQPVQEAIDYCKNPKNMIDFFIIKSIDRFTRGGSSLYDHMKAELNKRGVKLIDIYGVISNKSVNTLEHLDISYPWSVYNPSKKSELLEAERGHDELRDILSRMIGAEIRYTRLGYRVRPAPIGYQNEKIETPHGKRFILTPHPIESVWIRRMFELKEQGNMSDKEIINQINLMGFRTKRQYFRDPNNKNTAIGIKNDNPLTQASIDRLITNPIYAGVAVEKWTEYKPVKCQFEGLVTIDTFNKANTGRVMLLMEDGELKIFKGKQLKNRLVSTASSLRFPYKRLVLCQKCNHPFYGSASKGRTGSYYPAYHCNQRGHYHRVPLKKFHQTIVDYLSSIRIKNEFIEIVQASFVEEKEMKEQYSLSQETNIKVRIAQIDLQMKLIIEKIKFLHTEFAIKSLEEELERMSKEKSKLTESQVQISLQIQVNNIKNQNILQHDSNRIPEFIIQDHNVKRRTRLFNRLFERLPTYDELINGTALLKQEFELASA